MKKDTKVTSRYEIVKVSCGYLNHNLCAKQVDKCQMLQKNNCLVGDTKEQFVNKVATILTKIIAEAEAKKERINTKQAAKDVIEYLGIKK